jgi:signal transduction histidine kinase
VQLVVEHKTARIIPLSRRLEAITNLAYLIRHNKSLDEKARKHLDILDQELNRVADMARRTLGFYRDTSSAIPVSVGDLMDEVIAIYHRKIESKTIDVQREYQNHAKLSAFPGELRKAFSNLIANAIDAVANSGRITVRIRDASDWRDRNLRGVRISVADSGSGIGIGDHKKIFEPFYTTKKDTGTGLGLWLSKDIVKRHGGSISARSSHSPGRKCRTVFSVFVPTEADASSKRPVDQEQRTA